MPIFHKTGDTRAIITWVYMTIYSFVAVIDGMVSFQAGIVFFQVVQTLAEAVAVGVQWTEETILDETR